MCWPEPRDTATKSASPLHIQPQAQHQTHLPHTWFSQALREGLALPPVLAPLSPKTSLTHAWAFASQGGQVQLEAKKEKKAPRPSDKHRLPCVC